MNLARLRSQTMNGGCYLRQREYPQPPPPSKNNTTRMINKVSVDMSHLKEEAGGLVM